MDTLKNAFSVQKYFCMLVCLNITFTVRWPLMLLLMTLALGLGEPLPSSRLSCCCRPYLWSKARSSPSTRRSETGWAASRGSSRSPWWWGQRMTYSPTRSCETSCSSSGPLQGWSCWQGRAAAAPVACAVAGDSAAGDAVAGDERSCPGIGSRSKGRVSPPGSPRSLLVNLSCW